MRIKTCLRYPGGKFYGLKMISPYLTVPHDEFREVFVGGASVFLGKEISKINWINDIDSDLINFYKIIQDQKTRKQILKLIEGEVVNKKRYQEVLSFKPKNKVEEAFKYFYLNRTSFSGIMHKPRWGYKIGSSVEPHGWADRIEPVGKKLEGVKITSLDFREIISAPSKKEVLLYLDPPYFQASRGIYKNEFSQKDHLDLANLLRKTKHKFIVSYEDCQGVRDLYDWANINEIEFRYYMSEGRRDAGKELVITNFKLEDYAELPQIKTLAFA